MHFVAHVADLPIETLDGMQKIPLITPDRGSVHLASSVCRLPRAQTFGHHIHPHEQGFYILEGRLVLDFDGSPHQLEPGDYGVVPVGVRHAWRSLTDDARWLTVQAPQSQPSLADTIHTAGGPIPSNANQPDLRSPVTRYLGHFRASELPPPGEQQQAGYHGSGVSGVSIRMMIDGQLGANHMHVFIVEFEPGGSGEIHDHPYEESYFLLEGEAEAILEGQRYSVRAGDIVWTSVGASHGFYNRSDSPVRWIETQTPQPPRQHGHRFIAQWEDLIATHQASS